MLGYFVKMQLLKNYRINEMIEWYFKSLMFTHVFYLLII
jgi:hypothetical protein